VRFVAAEVTALDPAARCLSLAGRPALRYDSVSLDIGSSPELDSVPGAREHAVPVKPVAGLWQRWQALLVRLDAHRGRELRIAVVGGGAGSVELVLAMAHALRGRPVALSLYCGADAILAGYNRRARSAVEQALARHRVALSVGQRVLRVEPGELRFDGGDGIPFDELFWCTGAAAAPWVADSGLAVDEAGFLAVSDTLQSIDDPNVFGVGDIATQLKHPRPKAGVYAVRQGPVLAHNLRSLLLGRPLRDHRPQRRFLSLLSLGDRHATADRGPLSATGAWVWRWKDRIDRRFMQRFVDLPREMPPASDRLAASQTVPVHASQTVPVHANQTVPVHEQSASQTVPVHQQALQQAVPVHCGGCGAKVGADALGRVLRRLSDRFPEHCRLQDLGDDTSALPEAAAGSLVQSVDVLRALLPDPWLMGRIAANHALSDLYASGARPLTALASLTLPFATERLLERDLEQLLDGALTEFARAGCRLTGGHSLQGPELSIGFVVNGAAEGGRLPKTGLRPGDRLVLTRALGTGTVFARHMQLAGDGRHVDAAVTSMLRSNATAAELARSHGASAVTDVTGFGLAGHLLEMLLPGQGAELSLDALPLLPGALASLQDGFFSSMHAVNRESCEGRVEAGGAGHPALELLYDPQTSGGLLIGIEAARADPLCEALRRGGDGDSVVLGEVEAAAEGPLLRMG
jgi:selenide,water dikinase